MTDKKVHLVGRIDQIVRDFFAKNKSVNEIMAKDLMDLFIKKGVFKTDHRNGLSIRNLLRELDAENKLSLLKHLKPSRKEINTNVCNFLFLSEEVLNSD